MHFLVQQNMMNNHDYWRLTMALDRYEVKWDRFECIPFSDEVELPEIENPCVFYCSTAMRNRNVDREAYYPVMWDDAMLFDATTHNRVLGDLMLNAGAEVCQFQHIPEFEGFKFIRPVADDKLFAGTVIEGKEFAEWKDKVLNAHIRMFPEALCLVSDPVKILREMRFFVVDGKIVTGSQYRLHGQLKKANVDFDKEFWPPERVFAEFVLRNRWTPGPCFVMDVALLEDGVCKIVEFNCLNNSGFYYCDIDALVLALKEYVK